MAAPCLQPHRHPSSVAIMDELVDPNGSEMQHRRREGHCDNGGVEVVEPAMWDSSTLHSGSLPSIFDSSSACDPSQLPFTSADEMYASDVLVSFGLQACVASSVLFYCSVPPPPLPPLPPSSLKMAELPVNLGHG